mgnify:CR=1 FL=1
MNVNGVVVNQPRVELASMINARLWFIDRIVLVEPYKAWFWSYFERISLMRAVCFFNFFLFEPNRTLASVSLLPNHESTMRFKRVVTLDRLYHFRLSERIQVMVVHLSHFSAAKACKFIPFWFELVHNMSVNTFMLKSSPPIETNPVGITLPYMIAKLTSSSYASKLAWYLSLTHSHIFTQTNSLPVFHYSQNAQFLHITISSQG